MDDHPRSHDHDHRPPSHERRSRQGHPDDDAPSTPGDTTPPTAASYLPSSITGIMGGFGQGFGGLVRRFSDMASVQTGQPGQKETSHASPLSWSHYMSNNGIDGVYTPPMHRSASPMRPPPLEPLELKGFRDDTIQSARLLTPAVAEEIRIMVPERQRIEDEWNLVYSLDQDGASLGTLYQACSDFEGTRCSFVLVVKDNDGGLFGAYLSESPHPSSHYFGNGECFLWRASVLASLPPPPSEDTTHLTRVTTVTSPKRSRFPQARPPPPPPPPPEPEEELLIDLSDDPPAVSQPPAAASAPAPLLSPSPAPPSRVASPALSIGPSIRFKAFPYSGENDFYMYCEQHCLSVGGGDGHYGLWLNDSLDKGVSSRCLTFGNEPLSDEGEKFGVLGVELWLIGRGRRR